jgi:hypothetical protein
MLLPFFPLSPHRLAARSPGPFSVVSAANALDERRPVEPGGGTSWIKLGLPPRMAETEDAYCERAVFWMADVMAMHSDMIRDTGSTATVTGRLRYCMREETTGLRLGRGVPGTDDGAGSMVVTASWASRLILQLGRSGESGKMPVGFVDSCCRGGRSQVAGRKGCSERFAACRVGGGGARSRRATVEMEPGTKQTNVLLRHAATSRQATADAWAAARYPRWRRI